jgi:hypothetical protein
MLVLLTVIIIFRAKYMPVLVLKVHHFLSLDLSKVCHADPCTLQVHLQTCIIRTK